MDLSSINLNASADDSRKAAEENVTRNVGLIVGRLLQHLQTQTGGDEYELEALTAQMAEDARNGNLTLSNGTAPRPTGTPMALGAGTPAPADPASPEQEAGTKLVALVGEANVDGALALLERIRNGGFSNPDEALAPIEAVKGLVGHPQYDAFLLFVSQKAADIKNDDDTVRNDGVSGARKTLQSILEAQAAGRTDATRLQNLVDALVRESGESAPARNEGAQAFVQRVIAKVKTTAAPAPTTPSSLTYDMLGQALGITRNRSEDDATYGGRLQSEIRRLQDDAEELKKVYDRLTQLADDNSISYRDHNHPNADSTFAMLEKIVRYVKGGRFRKLNDN